MRQREPLDLRDPRPEAMDNYLKYNGWHFNKRLCDFATSKMKRMNTATGKPERLEAWTKDQVEELLTRHGVKLDNLTGYDHVYTANMAKSDYFKSSIADEAHLALFVKDTIDDPDAPDGHIFNRYYADCARGGQPIPWDDVL